MTSFATKTQRPPAQTAANPPRRLVGARTPGALAVNRPGDRFEREADSVADRVMRLAEPGALSRAPVMVRRVCAACAEDEERLAPRQATALQSVEDGEDEYPTPGQAIVQRQAVGAAPDAVAAPISRRLAARQGGGQPLPPGTRRGMEQAFGYDFSRVRIHRDGEAMAISRQLRALAFTHGRHIYFDRGMYNPAAPAGRRLLAHELTHVVQQGQAQSAGLAGGVAPAAGLQRSPAALLQRTATWSAGPVHEVNNLSDSLLNGTPVGVTWPTLNGSIFWSRAEARRLLARPTVNVRAVASGGFEASVATVPTNTGSFDETVLAPGPWTATVPKATVGASFPALTQCTGADNTNFRANGLPDDAAMFAANRRHEDRHALDHQNAFISNVLVWDIKLTVARVLGTTYHGATAVDAEAALHTAMGGTPDQIADAFFDACQAAVIAYHSTPSGGGVTAENPTANADCTTSSVDSRNPS